MLQLTLAHTARGTRLTHSRHHGPLYVQKPFYPEGPELAHLYLLHPPGGLVSGDQLNIHAQLQASARALFTTPGAGRIYRARSDRCLQQQHVTLSLKENSSVEWLPLETIVYPGAFGELTTRIELSHGSRYLGWEITCLGLPASQKPFEHGQLRQRLEIVRDNRLLLLDQLDLDAKNTALLHSMAGLQSNTVCGLMVAGPLPSSWPAEKRKELSAQMRQLEVPDNALLAPTIVGEFCLIRYLGNCSQQARQLFIQCWQELRPLLLERSTCLPRIWAT